jgi:hypothetical protein
MEVNPGVVVIFTVFQGMFRSNILDIDVEIYSELISSYFPPDPEGALIAAVELQSLEQVVVPGPTREIDETAEKDRIDMDNLDKFPKVVPPPKPKRRVIERISKPFSAGGSLGDAVDVDSSDDDSYVATSVDNFDYDAYAFSK